MVGELGRADRRVVSLPPGARWAESSLPAEAVIQLGEWDQSLVHGHVVIRVCPSHPEAAVYVDDGAQRVRIDDCPVDADRGAQDECPAGTVVAGGRRDNPKPSADEGPRGPPAEVLFHDCRDADITERPRPEREVQTARVAVELERQSHRADAAERDADPYAVTGSGALSGTWNRLTEKNQDSQEGWETLQGDAWGPFVSGVGTIRSGVPS